MKISSDQLFSIINKGPQYVPELVAFCPISIPIRTGATIIETRLKNPFDGPEFTLGFRICCNTKVLFPKKFKSERVCEWYDLPKTNKMSYSVIGRGFYVCYYSCESEFFMLFLPIS